MEYDRETWACVLHLMKRHGAMAEAHAVRRAEELLSDGDLAGYRRWVSIIEHLARLNAARAETPFH